MSFINWRAIGAVALPLVGGSLSGYLGRSPSKDWYESLKRPTWEPPGVVFPIAWTTLYSCMGYASYLVWKAGGGFSGSARLPLIVYAVQLALNFSWPPTFFREGNLGGSFGIIMALDIAVATTGIMFYRVSRPAGYLFIPYMAWLSLASCLNYWVWVNNPNHPKPYQMKLKFIEMSWESLHKDMSQYSPTTARIN